MPGGFRLRWKSAALRRGLSAPPVPSADRRSLLEVLMKPSTRILRFIAGAFVVFAGLAGAAHAADVSRAVLLVASDRLAGSSLEETVILAAPLPQGGHMGIVINR